MALTILKSLVLKYKNSQKQLNCPKKTKILLIKINDVPSKQGQKCNCLRILFPC